MSSKNGCEDASKEDIVTAVINKCWGDAKITDEENQAFAELIQTAEGKKMWISGMNEKRTSEKNSLPSANFGLFCGLNMLLLNSISELNDSMTAKQIMFLSQHFYEENSSGKIYLHQTLRSHALWGNHHIWVQMIISSVDLEMVSDAKLCEEYEDSIFQVLKLRPVLVSRAKNYIHQMKNFSLDDTVVKHVLKGIQEYYQLNLDLESYFFDKE